MVDRADERLCVDCEQAIQDGEKFLIVAGSDGRKQFVHTLCFTSTTFDPDRYQLLGDPDSTER